MGHARPAEEFFDRGTEHVIRGQARRVVRRAGLAPFDQEDIAQDLRLHLWAQRERHEDGRGCWTTFARCVIERKATVLLGRYRAERRNCRRVAYSFDAPWVDANGDVAHGGDRLDRDLLRRDGRHAVGRAEIDLYTRVDVGNAICKLEPGVRQLARLLMAHRVAEIAQATGIPRGTLYERIAQIRSAFVDQGIGASSAPTVWPPIQ